jgi:hypothetical protein
MNPGGLLWALALLFFFDLAMPLSPGAFQFEASQSLDIARRVCVQAASTQLPPPPHRFPAGVQPAPRRTERSAALRREATSLRVFLSLRNLQDESEALTLEADPPLPA